MTSRAIRATASLLIGSVLLGVGLVAPVTAAKKEKAQKAPPAVIATLKGVKYKMADAKIAKRVTRIADAEGDQRTNEGAPAPDAARHTDLVRVYVAPGEVQRKLLTKMDRDHPDGAVGAYYGRDAAWDVGDQLILVAAEMAKKRPATAAGQQLQIGVDGAGAAPMEVGAGEDDMAGLSRFSLSGIFNTGAWNSGTTDVSDHVPGDDIDWYNTESGVFGYYDDRKKTWYAAVPRPEDVERITVTVRSSTNAGEVVDRLELPGGGPFIDLSDPGGGLNSESGLPPLTCRALETYSASSSDPTPSDPEATLIRYTAGVDPLADADDVAELLAPARAAVGTVPMVVSPVGSDDEPLEVDGTLELVRGVDALTLTMEVPAGQWTFAPAEGAGIELPNGQSFIDPRTLTGSSGVLTGPGLDGVVVGDPSCGWDDIELPDDTIEDAVDGDEAAAEGDAPADEDAAAEEEAATDE